MSKPLKYKKEEYVIEDHPFEIFIPPSTTHLIIGTFPTFKKKYHFYYSGKDNLFWEVLSHAFGYEFKYNEGEIAVTERRNFLAQNKIGITDMHLKCYRRNYQSTDENLFPILFQDIFAILEQHVTIKTLVLTSRTEIIGALGLLKTYFIQQGVELKELTKLSNKILEGGFSHNGIEYKVLVPYSPSPRLIKENITNKWELQEMYKFCLTR